MGTAISISDRTDFRAWKVISNKKEHFIIIKGSVLHTEKETVNNTKRQSTEREKIFANNLSDKELVSKIYKNLSNSTPKNQTTQLRNGQKT